MTCAKATIHPFAELPNFFLYESHPESLTRNAFRHHETPFVTTKRLSSPRNAFRRIPPLAYTQGMSQGWPNLNSREIAALVETLQPEVAGLFVDRVIVPERPRFPKGYLKGEWIIRLKGRREEASLWFSVRPHHVGITLVPGKGPKAATGGTRSPFDLELSRLIQGAKVLGLEAIAEERTVVLWLTAEGKVPADEKLGLIINLIPAAAEAFFVVCRNQSPGPWPILTRSKTARLHSGEEPNFVLPGGVRKTGTPFEIREELQIALKDPKHLFELFSGALESEAFELRRVAAARAIRDALKQASERVRISEVSISEANREADWKRQGDLLKASLYLPETQELHHEMGPKGPLAFRVVRDFETGEAVRLSCDPKLDARAQVEKFYQLAKRRERRLEEAGNRARLFGEVRERLKGALAQEPVPGDWTALEEWERSAGISIGAPAGAGRGGGAAGSAKKPGWLGKSFVSGDGMPIWIGRNKDENLELTFKHARGNDLWLHVRGRPGAHAVIPLHSGKSAPLETLLDAAHLVIYYSGGEKWGKTEVDYTFKKYVKRIKDSSEASYTNNKTLLIAMGDAGAARLKRLLKE